MSDWWTADPVVSGRPAIPSEGRAFLSAIAGGESPSYNTMYGGGTFDGYADHPRQAIPITTGPNRGRTSSAAGMYQFLAPTWDQVRKEADLPDFSPESQDAGAWHHAQQVYKQRSGRDLLSDLKLAGDNPASIDMMGRYLSGVWTSLPGGIEPNKATGGFGKRYVAGLGQGENWWSGDPVAPPQAPGAADAPMSPMVANAIEPITSYPSTYAQMNKESRELMGEGVKQAQEGGLYNAAVGTGKAALGGLGYVTSPINAALRTVAGRPIERNLGVPKEYTEFAASMALPIPKKIPVPARAAETVERAAPTVQELKQAASAGFKNPDVTAVQARPTLANTLATDIRVKLDAKDVDEILAPKTMATIDKWEKTKAAGESVTISDIEVLRRKLGKVAGSIDKDERFAATMAKNAVDNFYDTFPKGAVTAGNIDAALPILKDARGNYAAAMKAGLLDSKAYQAELRSEAAGSGMNIGNTLRQRMADIAANPRLHGGWSPSEIAGLEGIVQGTPATNTARHVGNALGGGGGFGMTATGVGAALATGHPAALLTPLAGNAIRRLGNAMTERQVAALNNAVRSNSPLAQRLANPLRDFEAAAQAIEISPTPRNVARLTLASRNLSVNLKDAGVSISPTDLFKSIQGGAQKAAAENEQNQ